jgi:hypothetical protein
MMQRTSRNSTGIVANNETHVQNTDGVCLIMFLNLIKYFNHLEPTITTFSPTALFMARALRSVKTFKKSWDSDKALKSTYQGRFGKHQLRAYIFLALGYAVVAAWLTEMPVFACKKLFIF